jgi:hypothetical protein
MINALDSSYSVGDSDFFCGIFKKHINEDPKIAKMPNIINNVDF